MLDKIKTNKNTHTTVLEMKNASDGHGWGKNLWAWGYINRNSKNWKTEKTKVRKIQIIRSKDSGTNTQGVIYM